MAHWDVIIVGAGPAGASAAYDLAQQGLKVLILEKKQFPRLKPCAGGLTVKTLVKLRFPIHHLVHDVAEELAIGYKTKKQTVLKASRPICVFTVRKELDQYCLEQAQAEGTELRLIKGLAGIETFPDHVRVDLANGESLTCSFLLGADGAHSQVRKLIGDFVPDRTAVALEGLIPMSKIHRDRHEQARRMTLDFGAQPLGYGWLFPKSDHINVGLFTYLPESAKLSRQGLSSYAFERLGSAEFSAIHGYPIATGGEFYRQQNPRVLLVGDAAGMAEPLLGEGIHNAVATGQAAAASIIEHQKEQAHVAPDYQRRLTKIQSDVHFSRKMAGLFYRCLPVAYTALKRYPVANVLMNGFAAGLTLRECKNAFGQFTTEFELPSVPTLESL
ncbi:MAG: geranylgeranyl reductase family protein [Pseudomonadales bacterium]|nr:geranylgeranyl reductase family protein [Pseudomonadales bacterium]